MKIQSGLVIIAMVFLSLEAHASFTTTTLDASVSGDICLTQDPAGGQRHVFYQNDSATAFMTISDDGAGTWGAAATVQSSTGESIGCTVDSAGQAHASYETAANKIYHEVENAGDWSAANESVDVTGNNQYSAIVMDSGDVTHIVYVDSDSDRLVYSNDASGSWAAPTTIDSVNHVTGEHFSLAIDASDNLHVAYQDNDDYDLIYAMRNAATGAWSTTTIDTTCNSGKSNSIAADSSGKVHISYLRETCPFVDDGGYSAAQLIKYATNASGAWQNENVDTAASYMYETEIVSESPTVLHMIYYDHLNEKLIYAHGQYGSWTKTDLATGQNFPADILVNGDGLIDIAYQDRTNGDLKIAEQDPPACGNNEIETGETCDDGNTADGDGCSATCQTENPPVAEAGANKTSNKTRFLLFFPNVTMAGSASDPDGDAITYSWTLTTKPAGSARTSASIVNPTTLTPSFRPDKAGTYVLTLTVTDADGDTATDTATVTATSS